MNRSAYTWSLDPHSSQHFAVLALPASRCDYVTVLYFTVCGEIRVRVFVSMYTCVRVCVPHPHLFPLTPFTPPPPTHTPHTHTHAHTHHTHIHTHTHTPSPHTCTYTEPLFGYEHYDGIGACVTLDPEHRIKTLSVLLQETPWYSRYVQRSVVQYMYSKL